MTWKCLNPESARKHHAHRYFIEDKTGRIAVADWSMQLKDRPDTTDDGLLILDHEREVIVHSIGITVPVVSYADNKGLVVGDTLKQLAEVLPIFEQAGMAVRVQEALAATIRLLMPYVTTDSTDAWAENAAP